MMHMLAACEAVSSRGGGHLLEHPDDPGESRYEGRAPSIWSTPEMQEMERRTSATRHHLHQGCYGAHSVKPTCLSGTLVGLDAPGMLCSDFSAFTPVHGKLADGSFRTAPLARYPDELCFRIASWIVDTLAGFAATGSGPTGWRRSTGRTRRVTAWSQRASECGGAGVALLNECAVRGKNVIIEPGQQACYVHVDDGVIIGDPEDCRGTDAMMHVCADALEESGFQVDDRQGDGKLEKIVGYAIQRHPAQLRLPGRKSVLLVDSLRALARQPTVDVDRLRSVIGLWIWGALLRRELLSIPHAVFKLIEVCEGQVVTWWPSARREVLCMANAVIAMYADLGAALPATVVATDAMGSSEADCGGYGIVAATASPGDVRSCYEDSLLPGYTVCKLSGGSLAWQGPTGRLPPTCRSRASLLASWRLTGSP